MLRTFVRVRESINQVQIEGVAPLDCNEFPLRTRGTHKAQNLRACQELPHESILYVEDPPSFRPSQRVSG